MTQQEFPSCDLGVLLWYLLELETAGDSSLLPLEDSGSAALRHAQLLLTALASG